MSPSTRISRVTVFPTSPGDNDPFRTCVTEREASFEDLTRLARQEDEMPLPHPHFEAEQNVDGEDAPAKRAVSKVGEPAKTAEDDAWLVSLEQACKP